ncbi:MAG: hypothetical protein RJA70_2374 [Pseudomonadota bacterium]|jgi:serine/threonine-protein kinase
MNGSSVFLVAFFTSVLASVGTVFLVERLHVFEPPAAPPAELAVVPSLSGQSEAEARANLQALGLGLFVVGRESQKEAKPGTVIRQAIAPGQKANPGEVQSVVLAEAVFEVPEIVGQARDAAEAKLKEAGFVASFDAPLSHAQIPAGNIAAQSPKAGTTLKPGEEVELRVSAGPAEVEIPKLVGFSLAHAKNVLAEAGLQHAVRWVDLPETATYVVLRQTPDEGTKVQPDATVTLVINRE